MGFLVGIVRVGRSLAEVLTVGHTKDGHGVPCGNHQGWSKGGVGCRP